MDDNSDNEMFAKEATGLKRSVFVLSFFGVINLFLAIVIFVNTLPCVKQDGECSRGMIAIIAGFFAFFNALIGLVLSHSINKKIKSSQPVHNYNNLKTMESLKKDFVICEIMVLSPLASFILSIIIGNIIR